MRYTMLRVTPPDGPQSVIDLQTALSYVYGPMRATFNWSLEVEKRQDPNRVDRPMKRGARPVFTLVLIDGPDADDTPQIQQIVSYLLDDEVTVEISVDGGTRWLAVWCSKLSRADLKDKQFTGSQWDIELTAVEPTRDASLLR